MSPASAGGFFLTEPTRGAPCLISFHSFLVEKASALLASLLPQKVGHLDPVQSLCTSCSLCHKYSLHSSSDHSDLTIMSPAQRGLPWPPGLKKPSIPFLPDSSVLIICRNTYHSWYFSTSGSMLNSPAHLVTFNITSAPKWVTLANAWPPVL